MKTERAFKNKNVAKVFAACPAPVRGKLMSLREIIFDTAATIEGVGPLEKTLKWGQPSYLTVATGSGSTIRIDRIKSDDGRVAMYFHCQTDLVATFRELYPALDYEGNRSILFDAAAKIPEKALRHCIGLALTYHARKQTPAKKKPTAREKPASIEKRRPGKSNPIRTRRARPS